MARNVTWGQDVQLPSQGMSPSHFVTRREGFFIPNTDGLQQTAQDSGNCSADELTGG